MNPVPSYVPFFSLEFGVWNFDSGAWWPLFQSQNQKSKVVKILPRWR
jgi:hypothetical protein